MRKAVDPKTARFEQASEWLVKLEALEEVPLSPQDLQDWDEWAADDANRRAFDELAAVRQQLKSTLLPVWPSAVELRTAASSEQDLSSKVTGLRSGSSRRAYRFGWAWAAATAATVGLVLFLGDSSTRQERPASWAAKTYRTSAGERRAIELADGSTVMLGGASSFSAHYSDRERMIVLAHGEAFFDVSPDPARPFRVRAANGTITALGTRFNVRHGSRRVVVTVAEGAVQVAPFVVEAPVSASGGLSADEARWLPVRVERDQEMSYAAEGKASAVERTDAAIVTSWSRGTLVYARRPLAEVVEDVERYSSRPIKLDAGAQGLLYSGTVGERNVSAWIEGLPQIFPVEIEQTEAEVVIKLRQR